MYINNYVIVSHHTILLLNTVSVRYIIVKKNNFVYVHLYLRSFSCISRNRLHSPLVSPSSRDQISTQSFVFHCSLCLLTLTRGCVNPENTVILSTHKYFLIFLHTSRVTWRSLKYIEDTSLPVTDVRPFLKTTTS